MHKSTGNEDTYEGKWELFNTISVDIKTFSGQSRWLWRKVPGTWKDQAGLNPKREPVHLFPRLLPLGKVRPWSSVPGSEAHCYHWMGWERKESPEKNLRAGST
jgi:hypothetical protein